MVEIDPEVANLHFDDEELTQTLEEDDDSDTPDDIDPWSRRTHATGFLGGGWDKVEVRYRWL